MIIDAHTYIGDSIQGFSQSASDLRAVMGREGIDHCIICPVKPATYELWPENERIAEAARTHPDAFTGFARVDPRQGPRAADDLERAFAELGLRGLLLHPWEETVRINDRLVDPLLDCAERHKAPVLIETGYPWLSEALQVRDLARRHPMVPIMMTHGGQINISGLGQYDAQLTLDACPHVSIQTSGVYRQDFIEGVIDRFGAGRVVFGSRTPLMDARLEVLRVRLAHTTDEIKAAVLGENARALLAL